MPLSKGQNVFWQIKFQLYPNDPPFGDPVKPDKSEAIYTFSLPAEKYEMLNKLKLPMKRDSLLSLLKHHDVVPHNGSDEQGRLTAAFRKIDYRQGKMHLAFHQQGLLNDPDPQMPAILDYDLKEGRLASAKHFAADHFRNKASSSEIEILNQMLPIPAVPVYWLQGPYINS